MLEREILFLPCRHHIFEIILRGAFESKMGGTTGPDVPLFKRFQAEWPKIDKTKMQSCLTDRNVKKISPKDRTEILKFIHKTLEKQLPRDDYKELLLLAKYFLGDIGPNSSILCTRRFSSRPLDDEGNIHIENLSL